MNGLEEGAEGIRWDRAALEAAGRIRLGHMDWSFHNIARSYLENADSVLELGVGDGRGMALLAPLPPRAGATERNPQVHGEAKGLLGPLGVKVYLVKDPRKLPIEDQTYSLVLTRKEPYREKEIRRILRPGGCFIAQQRGPLHFRELEHLLEGKVAPNLWTLSRALSQMKEQGFDVMMARESVAKTRFYDMEALEAYLREEPELLPGLDLERHAAAWKGLHAFMEAQGFFDVSCHHFILVGMKSYAHQ
ncbi:class I SAM-dependent methyltransferase [Anaerotalea alkaliphila]|uniref:Class I SAM-dependent methyltransferase n=1 Tax=Anaerotalea alkaliphila TaxID=2662126 RepID=A0A7X5KP11_9FIRM|nr:class I SAM-dependent methyltransferase [Anaerotalea alkaliphila]NDL67352.1 class I SAM-dependent methyltransferase [Anaerotalea alkaliphila]